MPSKIKEYYKVGKIVGHRETSEGIEYKVHWADYSPSQDTWEPDRNLSNCQDYIQEYMDSYKAKSVRRSTRFATPDVPLFSTDEDDVTPSKSSKPPRTRRQKKSKTPLPEETKEVVQETLKPSTIVKQSEEKTTTRRSYSLRSSNIRGDLSSDDDKKVVSSIKKPMQRMRLSEARFRKQIADIGKKKFVSSTPLVDAITTRTQAKSKLNFNASHLEPSVQKKRTSTTTTEKTVTCTKIVDTVAEADDEDYVKPQSQLKVVEISTTVVDKKAGDVSYLPDVGWKEFALATFISGVGVIGYLCYMTDYC